MRGRLVFVLVLLAAAAPASALIPDPVEIALLGDILNAVRSVDAWLADVDQTLLATRDLMGQVWPGSSFQGIGDVFAEARSLRGEVAQLACGWKFSTRVRTLWDGVFSGRPFCKAELDGLFGPPPAGYKEDLDEALDFSSTLTIAQLRDFVSSSDSEEEGARFLLAESLKGRDSSDPYSPYGPGYSQRLSAVAAARLGKELDEIGNLDAADLRDTLLRSGDAHFRARKQVDLVAMGYSFIGGEVPFQEAAAPGAVE